MRIGYIKVRVKGEGEFSMINVLEYINKQFKVNDLIFTEHSIHNTNKRRKK